MNLQSLKLGLSLWYGRHKINSAVDKVTFMNRKYKSSPIIEAICQFQFEPDTSWDLTIPGLVYEKVQHTFPERNQVAQINIGFTVNAGNIGPQIGTSPLIQFLRKDGNALIQVGQHFLSINQLKPYTSWQDFLPLIEEGLQAYRETAHPKKLQRVALQYINRIEFEHSVKLEDYLNFYPYLGKDLPQTHGAFVVGVQIPYEDLRDLMNLQLITTTSESPTATTLLLDLNYMLVKPEEVAIDDIIKWINQAHSQIENTFEACLTDHLRLGFEEVKK